MVSKRRRYAITVDKARHAGELVAAVIADDHFASAEYRAQLCRVMTRKALLEAWQRATG